MTEEQFWQVIEIEGDVEVMHIANDEDHVWKLNTQEKQNVRRIRKILMSARGKNDF
jgi:hypothetical protein